MVPSTPPVRFTEPTRGCGEDRERVAGRQSFFRNWIVPLLGRRASTSSTLQTLSPTSRHLQVLQQVLANPIRSVPICFALSGVNSSPTDPAFDPISIGRAAADMIECT